MNENQKQERQVLVAILDTLAEKGYRLVNASDGEDWMGRDVTAFATYAEVLDWAMAADMGAIRYIDPQGDRFTLHLVLGNAPWEIVADISGANHNAIERGNRLIIPITNKAEAALR